MLGAPPAFVLSQDQTLHRDREAPPPDREGPPSLPSIGELPNRDTVPSRQLARRAGRTRGRRAELRERRTVGPDRSETGVRRLTGFWRHYSVFKKLPRGVHRPNREIVIATVGSERGLDQTPTRVGVAARSARPNEGVRVNRPGAGSGAD